MSFHRTSSPILTMPHSPAHHLALDRPYSSLPSHHPSSNFSHAPPVSSWSHFGQRSGPPVTPRGRKRSRDEAAVNLDPPEKLAPPIEPVKENDDEWEYGPGMVLIKKASGYVHDASNQSGTWLEERAAAIDAIRTEEAHKEQQRQAQERPSLRSHKSSRLDLSVMSLQQDSTSNTGVNSKGGAYSANNNPQGDLRGGNGSPTRSTAEANGTQPVIDDFTLHLGIGWSRLSDDEHIQAAARGWARYIENHYPVTEPRILLESKGLESYLVEAREGYFLFAENLRRGQLVSSDPQRALNNLKSSPPLFDGDLAMEAANTPQPSFADTMMNTNGIVTNRATLSNGAVPVPVVSTMPTTSSAILPVAQVHADMDMDMN